MQDSTRSSSGIRSLHTDVLWSIFNINADIRDNCPLKTARLTSQVCGLWRNLLLTSPGIWGKILKLAELQIDKDDSPWRDLVMERTGHASLFFEGTLSPTRVEWFLAFISSYWGRICHLDTPSAGPGPFLSTNTDFMDEPSRCVVFHLTRVPFNLQSPWIPNLRSISLSTPLSTTRILECLDHMPHLEHAKLSLWLPDVLNETFTATILVEPKKILLPHLTNLHISHFYSFVAHIFQRITANPLCSYTICTGDDPTATTAQREIFSGYFQRHIDSLTASRVKVMVVNDGISVKLSGDTSNRVYYHSHSVGLSVVPQSDVSTYMSLFYSGTSTSGITELDFDIKVTAENKHLNQTLHSIKNFLSAFSSVTTLILSPQALPIFTGISSVNEALFPSLAKVILGFYETLTPHLQSQIVEFLHQRQSYGRPIKKLCLGLIRRTEKLNLRWGFLEEFDGMEVVFRLTLSDGKRVMGTYLCGSGTPDELDMIDVGEIDLCSVGIYEMERPTYCSSCDASQ